MNEFVDENRLLRAEPNEPADNAFLYTMYLFTRTRIKTMIPILNNARVNMEKRSGEYSQVVFKSIEEDRCSHDDMTAIMCFMYQLNDKQGIMRLKTRYYLHPRDFVFYNYLKYPRLMLPFLWITSVCMIWTCWHNYNTKEGRLDVDGKLLSWLRFSNVNMPITKYICEQGLEKTIGRDYLQKLFDIYFWRYPDHPLRSLFRALK